MVSNNNPCSLKHLVIGIPINDTYCNVIFHSPNPFFINSESRQITEYKNSSPKAYYILMTCQN